MTLKIEPPLTKEKLELALELAKTNNKRNNKKSGLRKWFGKGTKGLNPMKIQKQLRNEWN